MSLMAGVATIFWILAGAEVSKGGLLGLLGATTVAWPVVLGGAAIVGISAFALGDQTKRMFAKSKDKFIDGIRAHFWQMMVANDQENVLAQQMQKTVLHFHWLFNLRQIGLALLTLVMLSTLFSIVESGPCQAMPPSPRWTKC